MFQRQGLTELEEAQRHLVMQADIHRSLLQLECALLRQRLGWVEATQERWRANRPWVIAAAAAAGFLAFRYGRGLTRWLPAVFFSLRVARKFLAG